MTRNHKQPLEFLETKFGFTKTVRADCERYDHSLMYIELYTHPKDTDLVLCLKINTKTIQSGQPHLFTLSQLIRRFGGKSVTNYSEFRCEWDDKKFEYYCAYFLKNFMIDVLNGDISKFDEAKS